MVNKMRTMFVFIDLVMLRVLSFRSRRGLPGQRWQQASDTINRLTNFKKTPVKEGSAAYQQCLAASRIIQDVEQKAPGMTAEKTRLETLIKELEKN